MNQFLNFLSTKLTVKQQHWLDFLLAMTEKEIKIRYKNVTLGFLWAVINPLLQMLIIGLVFQFLIPVKVDNYFLFLLTGLLPWIFFSSSINKCTPAIIHQRDLIQKAKFPRETIIISTILSNMLHLLISLIILISALAGKQLLFNNYSFFQLVNYLVATLAIFPLLIWLGFLTAGLSLLFSALNVKNRDVNFLVQAITPLWFYATPIVYSLNLLPTRLHLLFYLNPIAAIIEGFHLVLLQQKTISINLFIINIIISILIFIFGWKIFKQQEKYFIDKI